MMEPQVSFHKLLERVVRELADAHEHEIAEVQRHFTESVIDAIPKESHLSLVCSNQLHQVSAFSNEFAAASFHDDGSWLAPVPPTPPRVFESRWEEPRQPMLRDDLSDLDDSHTGSDGGRNSCACAVEVPEVVELDGEDMIMAKSTQVPGFDIDDLPTDYLESLQIQFNLLDRELEGRIRLDRCLEMLRTCTDTPLSEQDLIDSVADFHSSRQSFNQAFNCHDLNGAMPTLDFIDFVFLMTQQDEDDDDDDDGRDGLVRTWPVRISKIQKAFREYNAQQLTMAHKAEERIRRHKRLVNFLEVFPAPVIFVNSIVMGLRVDMAPDSDAWKCLDVAFLLFYMCEAAVKVWVFGCGVYLWGPGKAWNWFDVSCICLSLCDLFMTYAMPLFASSDDMEVVGEFMMVKTLRLARVARLVKALNYPIFKELKAMVNGVVSGIRVVLWGIVLLLATIFCIGLAMNHIIGDDMQEFNNLDASMFTTFRCFTDGCTDSNGAPLHERLRKKHGMLVTALYTIAYMFVVVGVFNLIMATFLENVVSNSHHRMQEELCLNTWRSLVTLQAAFVRMICAGNEHSERLISARLQAKIETQKKLNPEAAFRMLPPNLTISKPLFRRWLLDEDFIEVLEAADIETTNTSQLFDVLDADMSGHLSLRELLDGLMRLRGPIVKSDVVAIRMSMRVALEILQTMQNREGGRTVEAAVSMRGRMSERGPFNSQNARSFILL